SPDRGLPAELSLDRHVLWKAKTPNGHSSPIVDGGRVMITGSARPRRVLLCFDARTGAELWRKAVTRARSEAVNPLNGPATPTPVSDGKSVYVYFPEVGLLAYTLDGRERWRAPLGPFGSIQGMAVSPIFVEGNV